MRIAGFQVTSYANSVLARNISAQATVLLKNNGVLPLKPGAKVTTVLLFLLLLRVLCVLRVLQYT